MCINCGLRYCDATISDYEVIKTDIKCPCLDCLGAKRNTCDMYKKSAEWQIDLQKMMCQKCRFYNGK